MRDWLKWPIERVARFRQFPAHKRPYLFEIMFYLLAARLALWVIPFRWLIWFFERPPKRPQEAFAKRKRIGASASVPFLADVGEDKITTVERARFEKKARSLIELGSWFLPGETVCLPRAIAAQTFLRRLGIGTTLYYGAATLAERGLTGHAWLQDGDEVIVGQTDGKEYHTLAHYPNSQTAI